MDLVIIAGLLVIVAIAGIIDGVTTKDKDAILFTSCPLFFAFIFYYMAFTARPGTIGYLAVYGVLGK